MNTRAVAPKQPGSGTVQGFECQEKQPGSGTVQEFEYQVAGHPGVLVVEGNDMLIKPLNKREQQFYEGAMGHADVKSFLPIYYGSLKRDGLEAGETREYICLENLVHGFEQPCVLDLKIGSRLYDVDATEEKRERMALKARSTTSEKLGVVITGMKLHGEPASDRDWCRGLTVTTFMEALDRYFSVAQKAVSPKYREYLIWQFIVELGEWLEVVQETDMRMYSSSLLFIYDASKAKYTSFFPADEDGNGQRKTQGFKDMHSDSQNEEEDEEEDQPDGLLDMKAIDFAHSHWVPGQGPDEDYIAGVTKLIEILHSFLEPEAS
ncbi:hypothetical protein GGF46_001981 [Coemansia sp. RSA 552]|nr:hypothetical protein GGF46_001981 [Coemansia sp. RSA 552]